jgi:iron complex outermembrane receptor protein
VSRDESEDLPEGILLKELSGIKVMLKRSSAYIIPSLPRRLLLSAVSAILLISISGTVQAQDSFADDTVNISAVTVTARAAARVMPYTVVTVDHELISRRQGDDMASLLHSSGMLYVKRYGNHGLASVSVRGLTGSHTLVTWNGMPLNSPGNGYSDFAVIPVVTGSSVKISAGGFDLTDLSGFLGGKIELAAEPHFGAGKGASLSLGAGSYGDYGSSATITLGGDSLSFRAGGWANRAKNDFIFINRDAPGGDERMRRTNAAFSSGGVTGDLFYTTGHSHISMHVWYSQAGRQLPGPVTTVQQDFKERQTDRSVRGVVNYSLDHGRITTKVTAGVQHEINRYYHMVTSYNGDNSSSSAIIKARIALRVTRKTTLELGAGDSYERAVTLSYDGKETRNLLSFSFAGKSTPLPRLNLLFQVRQAVVTGIKVSPEFTAGASWHLTPDGEHLLKASFSRSYRLPCLNDLYWIPGGNPELVPESSAGGELTWSFLRVQPEGTRGTLNITVHASHVNDMIQWVPGSSGLWRAENVKDVSIAGVEARAGRDFLFRNWTMHSLFNYSFTRPIVAGTDVANDRSIGRQLIYVPLHNVSLNLSAARKWFSTGLTAAWESRRYTTSDNSEWLPGSLTTDAFAGAGFKAGVSDWRAEFAIDNIAGMATESVRNYPMPLRTFKIKLTLTWSEKKKKDETPD